MCGHLVHSRVSGGGALLCGVVIAIAAYAQPEPDGLAERQARLHAELRQLEDRLLRLSRTLSTDDDARQARVGVALDHAGRAQLQVRLGEAVARLRAARYDQAEAAQAAALADLREMLVILQTPQRADTPVAAQTRLGELQNAVSELLARQQALRERLAATLSDAALSTLANEQVAAQQQTEQVRQQQLDSATRPSAMEALAEAARQMDAAAQRMRAAQRSAAAESQQQAVEALQTALAQIDRALDDLREQARAAQLAEIRRSLERMIAAERQTRDLLPASAPRPAALSERDRLSLRAAAEAQRGVHDDAVTLTRDLAMLEAKPIVRWAADDVERETGELADALRREDVGVATRERMVDVISQLEALLDVLGASAARAPEEAGDEKTGESDAPRQALDATELKLLRAAQERLAQRTAELDAESPSAVVDDAAARQRELVELTQAMMESLQ